MRSFIPVFAARCQTVAHRSTPQHTAPLFQESHQHLCGFLYDSQLVGLVGRQVGGEVEGTGKEATVEVAWGLIGRNEETEGNRSYDNCSL